MYIVSKNKKFICTPCKTSQKIMSDFMKSLKITKGYSEAVNEEGQITQ
jgi:hypothetical protein